jgi:transketolase C-terminal domain/subunit
MTRFVNQSLTLIKCKICASHAGLTLGEDGATHQILEDIGLMKMLPGMTVINTVITTKQKRLL